MSDPRPCERKCIKCETWKHHSRFRSWRDKRYRNSSISVFSQTCRACEQIARNEKKNVDRPRAIVEGRAATAAAKAGMSKEFFLMHMGYRALVPELRGLMTDEGLCKACGHEFLNERDIQIEHIEPPRSLNDWARLHARNLRFCCGSCNQTKGHKPFADWLDEQEEARLSNLQQPSGPMIPVQLSLELAA